MRIRSKLEQVCETKKLERLASMRFPGALFFSALWALGTVDAVAEPRNFPLEIGVVPTPSPRSHSSVVKDGSWLPPTGVIAKRFKVANLGICPQPLLSYYDVGKCVSTLMNSGVEPRYFRTSNGLAIVFEDIQPQIPLALDGEQEGTPPRRSTDEDKSLNFIEQFFLGYTPPVHDLFLIFVNEAMPITHDAKSIVSHPSEWYDYEIMPIEGDWPPLTINTRMITIPLYTYTVDGVSFVEPNRTRSECIDYLVNLGIFGNRRC